MKSFWDYNYLVVDVETSGSNSLENRIIDIGCVLVNSGQIISEYTSLINPHQFIPEYIAKMTGISNEKAFTAPEIENIFPNIECLFSTENTVFVAHNASFDWSFIRETYIRLGKEVPQLPRLCSLKLARKLLPSNVKKGLDSLSSIYGISNSKRHRALGDAIATARVLIELLDKVEFEHDVHTIDELLKFQNKKIKNYRQPASIAKKLEKQIEDLPSEPGVYYYRDKFKKIIYIGKAKSLKDRVRSYFAASSQPSKKIIEMTKRISTIEWECTGTELAALLLESKEIKRHKPKYNSMELRYRKSPFIKINYRDEFPLLEICSTIECDDSDYFGPFRNRYVAVDILEICRRRFKLRKCETMPSPHPDNQPCFYYQIQKCFAPCAEMIDKKDYRKEIERVKHFLSGNDKGIIPMMESRMFELSDSLKFESAALLRNRINELRRVFNRADNIPSSVNDHNLILILPASMREKTVEIFLIRTGKLMMQVLLGRKAPTKTLEKSIHDLFFNGFSKTMFYTLEDIDELRIISHWLNRQDKAYHIYLNGKSESQIIEELKHSIKNAVYQP